MCATEPDVHYRNNHIWSHVCTGCMHGIFPRHLSSSFLPPGRHYLLDILGLLPTLQLKCNVSVSEWERAWLHAVRGVTGYASSERGTSDPLLSALHCWGRNCLLLQEHNFALRLIIAGGHRIVIITAQFVAWMPGNCLAATRTMFYIWGSWVSIFVPTLYSRE